MALSRSQRRELERIKDSLGNLWEDSRDDIEDAAQDALRTGRRVANGAARAGQRAARQAATSGRRFAADTLDSGARLAQHARAVVAPSPSRKGPGVGGYILIGLGLALVASVAYAAWQTLRADESLWIEDVDDEG